LIYFVDGAESCDCIFERVESSVFKLKVLDFLVVADPGAELIEIDPGFIVL